MNLFKLVWSYLKSRPLNTILNILLLGLGTAMIVVLIIFSNQLESKIERDVKGIDLVVGAKGSPLQIILCSIFHIDFPTGNINLAEAERISRGRLIKQAIPLALGDSYHTYRIVGTGRDYAALYQANLQAGEWWSQPMEATLGYRAAKELQLKVGDTFASSHGMTSDLDKHENQLFHVTGIMNPTQSVLDNLILTSVESIWMIHEDHTDMENHNTVLLSDSSHQRSHLVPSVPEGDSTKEITSLLLLYRSPMAAVQLPRLINSQTSMQAASPAFETARLFSILGIGVEVIMYFAYVLIFIAALSIFIALYNSLKERRYDLAIMRSMGASRTKLMMTVVLEGVLLTTLGCMAGLILGHGVLIVTMHSVSAINTDIDGLTFYKEEGFILIVGLLLGIISSAIPGIQAYRTNISTVLASYE